MKLKLLVTSMAVFFATCGEVMAAAGFLRGKDTSCAVVLYNGARYAMEASLDDVFVRKSYHRKVKILTEEGLRYATVTIPYYRFMEYTERVSGIKVTVSNGEVDAEGNPVVRKMNKECIQDIKHDFSYREKKFVVPDVSPGDTIEIRYEVLGLFPAYWQLGYDGAKGEHFFTAFGFMTRYGLGEDIVFPKWNFQEDIPVLESSLEVSHFDDYLFGYALTGDANVTFTEQNGGSVKIMRRAVGSRPQFSISTGTDRGSSFGTGAARSSTGEKALRMLIFRAQDLLPLEDVEESYVINPQKYKSSVDFNFKGRKIEVNPQSEIIEMVGDYNYSNSWTDVGKILFNSRYFGRKIFYSQDFYREYADSVANLSVSDYEKVQLICNHIRNDLECTSQDRGMFISSLRDIYTGKRGSNVDICAIAYKTLDRAGFRPKMVMLKSRDAGHLHTGVTSVGALNNAVLHLTLKDGSIVLFDPTGNPKDTRLLNPMYLVRDGIVYNGGEERINLMNAIENKEYHNAALFVGPNGMVSGICRSIFTNHSAYGMEGAAPQINAEEGEVKYGILDSLASRYTREFTFRRTSAVMVDDRIFVNPFAEKYFSADEFSGPRTYPVEFRNPKTIEYTATINLPDGYEVYELPQKVAIHQPLCGASATLLSKVQGNLVQFGLTVKLDNATIQLEHYECFREWWQQMCTLFEEMIILRKKGGKSFTETEKMTA